MFLRENYNKKTGRTYLQIVHGYRDKDGKSKSKTIKSIGYLDELEKVYDEPIAHFKQVAKQMENERLENDEITIKIKSNSRISKDEKNRKNFGHVVFNKVFHELQLNRFFNNKQRHERFEYDSNSIMKVLLFARLLYPCSKKKTVEIKDTFFDKADFTLDDVYNCLKHFNKIEKEAQQFIHEQIVVQYGRNTDLIYYDVTNFYFEIDQPDEFRKKGACKSNSSNPIVQMGLAVDTQGIPISYQLFEGNTHDSQTLMPVLNIIKKQFQTNRVIVVADKGLNSGDNIAFNTILGDGYIYSQSVKGASEAFKKYVLDDEGYRWIGKDKDYKIKSRITPTTINVTVGKYANGKNKKKKVTIDQKQVIFYSRKYAVRSKRKREETIAKALDLIANPAKYTKATSHGAAAYVANIDFDKETGEVKDTGKILFLDKEKIKQDELLDGYYAIVTSEFNESDERIVELYHGLWKIEESFKVTKSYLGARPVYLTLKEHINAHFFVCFISLVIARIVEIRLKNKYTIEKILDSLRSVSCSHMDTNHYLFDYVDEVTDDINEVFNLDIGQKVMTLKEIKKVFAKVKK
ncbi:MAG: IS1634 family transposase [Bacteroidales bacterium]|jgi:transposase|nr:IS1634 family transposase [Bacteroidales bacterium]